MAATLIEKQNCGACGVDVREGALFCYNCGGSVTPESAISDNDKAISDAWFREDIAEEDSEDENANAKAAEIENTSEKKQRVHETARLRSAAALRRKSKNFQKRRVDEVVWEEYEDASNGWFVFVAVVVTLITAVIFLLATYLK